MLPCTAQAVARQPGRRLTLGCCIEEVVLNGVVTWQGGFELPVRCGAEEVIGKLGGQLCGCIG